jgi:hypothetical protein
MLNAQTQTPSLLNALLRAIASLAQSLRLVPVEGETTLFVCLVHLLLLVRIVSTCNSILAMLSIS